MAVSRIWLSCFALGFLVLEALLVLALTTPAPYGDLSRIGQASDRQFGWTAPQPAIAAELTRAAPARQADILVIGDSFSRSYGWQSEFARQGYRIATVSWDQIDESLCADFDQWLKQTGFRGKLVVIESIERTVDFRLRKSAGCAKMKSVPDAEWLKQGEPQLQDPPDFALNWDAKLVTGWNSLVHSLQATRSGHDIALGDKVRSRVVEDGCAMFSHRLCGKALFFRDDDLVEELNAAHAEQIQAFAREHASVPMLWMIIPDKTTTYIEPTHGQAFVTALSRAGSGPDLFAWAQAHKAKVRDFYFPNDTHLSMRGQLLLGQRMLEAARGAGLGPPSPPPAEQGGG